MSTPNPPRLSDLPVVANPHTDQDPLVVRDHPFADNPVGVVLAVLAIIGPLIAVVVRAIRELDPVLDGATQTALWIGIPLGLLLLWFLRRLSSRTVVRVGGSSLTRARRRPTAEERTVSLDEIRGGLLATAVRYFRGRAGTELILFLTDGSALWVAGGLRDADIRRIADALSDRGIKEYADPTTSAQLLALVKALREPPPASPE